jgi:hypothetical protein
VLLDKSATIAAMGFQIKRPTKIQQRNNTHVLWPTFAAVTDLMLKWSSIAAILVGGGWAFYRFVLAGSDDWTINMAMTADVIPYYDNLRLVEVHVKTKNPRDSRASFAPPTDKYTLIVRNVPPDLKSGTAFDFEHGAPIATVDLMPVEGYELVPNAEFDDMAVVVLPAGSIVTLSAVWRRGDDYVSVEKLVKVEP